MDEPRPFSNEWWHALAAELRGRGLAARAATHIETDGNSGLLVAIEQRRSLGVGGFAIVYEPYRTGLLVATSFPLEGDVRGGVPAVANAVHVGWLRYLADRR